MTQRFTNVADVPLALAVFLASDYYDYNTDPNTISTTTLLKPLRQIILPARMPVGEGLVSLPDQMSNRLGAAVHDGIERAWLTNNEVALRALGYPTRVIERIRINPTAQELAANPNIIPIYLEQRLKKQIGKWTVTGKFDFVGEGRVTDFKTASVWSYLNQVNADKQTLQGSIYRWLDPKLITQDEMDIIHIFMDWKAGMVKTDPKYPPQRFKRQIFPLLSVAETESFIRRKIAQIEAYWEAPEDEIPQCDDEELWRSEPVFKYYKNPANASKPGSRSTKNFDTEIEANTRRIEDGSVGVVKEVPGQVTACKYCASFAICSQKDDLIRAGQLIMGEA
jgi:hypothetical protein